jgi:hypothetical protein
LQYRIEDPSYSNELQAVEVVSLTIDESRITKKHVAIHVGIVSFLSSTEYGSTDPAGFTRTYPHGSWINNIITKYF